MEVLIRQGIIRFVSGKGWYFAEDLLDHSSVFIHQRDIVSDRYLHEDDRVDFVLAENPKHPGKMCGTSVKYVGHTIARQISERQASAEAVK